MTDTSVLSDQPLSWELLDRYLAGECSPGETATVQQMLASTRDAECLFRELCGGVRDGFLLADGQTFDLAETLTKLRAVIAAETVSEAPTVHPDSLVKVAGKNWLGLGARPLRRVLWSVGGAVALAAIMTLVGWEAGRQDRGVFVTSMSTYTTNPGQRANITLPDGGTVALGVASRLDVPADYGRGHHTVRLMGEALFTVAHRDRTPFTVMVGTTAVRVLGTSFVVRNYATDSTTLVAVRDGKVAVRSVVVAAQQQIELSRGGMRRLQPADPARFSFATGVLTLDHVPLSAAIEELNRWYDADIRVADPRLRTQKMAARLKAGSLTDLAEMLVLTFNVRVVRDGRVLTLFPR